LFSLLIAGKELRNLVVSSQAQVITLSIQECPRDANASRRYLDLSYVIFAPRIRPSCFQIAQTFICQRLSSSTIESLTAASNVCWPSERLRSIPTRGHCCHFVPPVRDDTRIPKPGAISRLTGVVKSGVVIVKNCGCP